jgi:hypothetical protein
MLPSRRVDALMAAPAQSDEPKLATCISIRYMIGTLPSLLRSV